MSRIPVLSAVRWYSSHASSGRTRDEARTGIADAYGTHAMTGVLALLSGSLVGFSLGLIGGGGSILAVPLLLYVVGTADPHVAIGTSALAVSVNAFVNLLGHWRAGTVKWPCASVFAAAGIAG